MHEQKTAQTSEKFAELSGSGDPITQGLYEYGVLDPGKMYKADRGAGVSGREDNEKQARSNIGQGKRDETVSNYTFLTRMTTDVAKQSRT